jgi:hypothetical protein
VADVSPQHTAVDVAALVASRRGHSSSPVHLTMGPRSPRDFEEGRPAWQEGFNAGRRGFPRRNSYTHRGDEALASISGYVEGRAKPLQSVKDAR